MGGLCVDSSTQHCLSCCWHMSRSQEVQAACTHMHTFSHAVVCCCCHRSSLPCSTDAEGRLTLADALWFAQEKAGATVSWVLQLSAVVAVVCEMCVNTPSPLQWFAVACWSPGHASGHPPVTHTHCLLFPAATRTHAHTHTAVHRRPSSTSPP